MKRRSFFGRILAAFGIVAAEKVIARGIKPTPTPSVIPSPTPPSVTPTITPSSTRNLYLRDKWYNQMRSSNYQVTPRYNEGYVEYWFGDENGKWVRDWSSKR